MKSIKMILLSVLLLAVVSFSNAHHQHRRCCHIHETFSTSGEINITETNCSDTWNRENEFCTPSCWFDVNNCTSQNSSQFTMANISDRIEQFCSSAVNNGTIWDCDSTQMRFMCSGEEPDNYTLSSQSKSWFRGQLSCGENRTVNISDPLWIGLQFNYTSPWFDGGYSKRKQCYNTSDECSNTTRFLYKTNENEYAYLCCKIAIHMSRENLSWEDAMDYCDQEAAGALLIQSDSDHNETEQELRKRKVSGPVWVGLRQSRLFGFWIWTNGVNVGVWTNWTGGSLPEYQMSQHCGALVKVDDQYKLTVEDCQSKMKVLCVNKSLFQL